jgi:hypothetical protein
MKHLISLLIAVSLCVLPLNAVTLGSAFSASSVTPVTTSATNTYTGTNTFGANGTAITSLRFGSTAALVAGTLVVSDAGATANTRYFFTTKVLGTVTVASSYYVSARSNGVSFTITSNQPTDTSTVDWLAIN